MKFRIFIRAFCLFMGTLSLSDKVLAGPVAETISIENGNWAGDINTENGLDTQTSGDRDCLVVSGNNAIGFPASAEVPFHLSENYSNAPFIDIEVGYRRNASQAKNAELFINNVKVGSFDASGPTEELATKLFTIPTVKLPLQSGNHTLKITAAPETPAEALALFEVDAIRFHLRSDPSITPEKQQWLLVAGENSNSIELRNLELLRKRLNKLNSDDISTRSLSALTESDKQNYNIVLTGSADASPQLQNIMATRNMLAAFNGKAAFVQEQGYSIGFYPNGFSTDKMLIIAGGKKADGATFAMGHLASRLMKDASGIYLAPNESSAGTSAITEFYPPDRPIRGIYYNIAYGFSLEGITPETFTDQRWREELEEVKTMRLTHVYFYLWGNIELNYPKSPVSNTSRNQMVHARLQKMIKYAQSLGLKVSYLYSPTVIPQDIFDANPAIRAQIEYVDQGFSCISPCATAVITFAQYTWANVWDLMHDIYDNEIEQFKNVDELQHWFYDPGGSFDSVCKANQAAMLLRQVREFTDVAKSKNPNMKISINFWPVWILEDIYNVSFRNQFFDNLITEYGVNGIKDIIIYDSIDESDTSIRQAYAKGFPVGGFIFPTNVESGYPFTVPMLSYLKNVTNRNYGTFQSAQLQGMYFMRIEAGLKKPNSWFASELLWDRTISTQELTRRYGRWAANGNFQAGEIISAALTDLDSFSNLGKNSQNMETKGAAIQAKLEQAAALLKPAEAAEIEWLVTTGKIMSIYGKAIVNSGNNTVLNNLREEFRQTLTNSPGCSALLSWGYVSVFARNTQQLSKGWTAEHF